MKSQRVHLTINSIKAILEGDKPDRTMALYLLYVYAHYQQKTNPIKLNTMDAAKTLRWSLPMVRRIKETLIYHNLVENVIVRKDGRIREHRIGIKFIY